MLVVADSSPINILVVIEHIGVLPVLFERVVIPTQVQQELQHPSAPEAVRAFMSSAPDWLSVRAVEALERIELLDPGEEAAISLVREVKADALLVDDRDGRQAAIARGIPIIGTLGVLERAAARDLIGLREASERLARTTFRIDPRLVRMALERDAQRRG